MSETAYDTAWAARVVHPSDPSRPAFPSAQKWLLVHQRPDGSWGASTEVLRDRAVSTLAAVVALSERPASEHGVALARGLAYLDSALRGVDADPVQTVGFELIMPPLLRRAQELGLALPSTEAENIGRRRRAAKLHRLPAGFVYTRPSSLTHSLEFLGDDLQPELARQCQAENGSYGASPSATAYVLRHQWDELAASYLREVVALSPEGGVCNVHPFEVFERAWVLYNLGPMQPLLVGDSHAVDVLRAAWTPAGTSFTAQGMVPDGDDTAVVLKVLRRYGISVQSQVLKLFEADDYFHCFPLELDQSVSANAHILDALKECSDLDDLERLQRKAVTFLREVQIEGCYWRDKWHVSPYYATCHAMLALLGAGQQAEKMATAAADWLLETQRPNGSWSERHGDGTSEETAYALQGLLALPNPKAQQQRAIDLASSYLWQHFHDQDYPELWVGKGLYTPYAVVRSAVLGALYTYEQARPRSTTRA